MNVRKTGVTLTSLTVAALLDATAATAAKPAKTTDVKFCREIRDRSIFF